MQSYYSTGRSNGVTLQRITVPRNPQSLGVQGSSRPTVTHITQLWGVDELGQVI